MPFRWKQSLSVGVAEIDARNKKIFTTFEKLLSASEAGMDLDTLEKPLRGLVDYTKDHFSREEDLLEKHGFPSTTAHRAEHQRLIEDIEWLQRQFKNEDSPAARGKTLNYLGQWLTEHISGYDFQYRLFLKSRGIF